VVTHPGLFIACLSEFKEYNTPPHILPPQMNTMRRKTTEQTLEDFKAIHGGKYGYSLVEYKGTDKKVVIVCATHGQFLQRPHRHLQGDGCPKCKVVAVAESHRHTTAMFIEKSKAKHGADRYSYSKTVYTASKAKVDLGCNVCGTNFSQLAGDHLKGSGCPKCAVVARVEKNALIEKVMPIRTTEESFVQSLNLADNISYVAGSFKGVFKPAKFLCQEHGEFTKIGNSARTSQYLCPECVGEQAAARQFHNLDQVIDKANRVHGQYTYRRGQEYKGNRTLLEIICPTHGAFTQMAMAHLAGQGCRACGYEKVSALSPYFVSKGEQEIADHFKPFAKVVQSDRDILWGQELDIYFPEHKVAVEYNGLYFHGENFKKPGDHLGKLKKCQEAGVDLIQIYEDEWQVKPEIVKSIISSRLGIYSRRVPGRKTQLVEVSSVGARKFYDENHIQGFVGCRQHYGLVIAGEIVSMASFSSPREIFKTVPADLELVRFCHKLNTTVIGGFKKLLKAVQGKTLMTYCDKRLFNGAGYLSAGFLLSHESAPGFDYVKGTQRRSRFQYQKHKLSEALPKYDPNLTAEANMKANGFKRIYGCGNMVLTKAA
jgi:protein-arginine kinase activator protein McsA